MNACWCPEACQHPPVLVCFIIDGDGQSSVASLQQMLLMYACNHSAINRQICLTMLHTNCCIICRDCMSDSEEESYVYFGTALQEEAESRAGQHSKALQDPSLTKSLPVWKQASIHICFSLKCHACSLLSWPTSHAHWRTFLWTQVCHNALYAIAVLLSFVTMHLPFLAAVAEKHTHAGGDRRRRPETLSWSFHWWVQRRFLQHCGIPGGLAAQDFQVFKRQAG